MVSPKALVEGHLYRYMSQILHGESTLLRYEGHNLMYGKWTFTQVLESNSGYSQLGRGQLKHLVELSSLEELKYGGSGVQDNAIPTGWTF